MKKTSIGLALTAACLIAPAAWAQNPVNPASAPTPVGTTQPKANEAMREAVPRSNVGTVVRTGETPAQAAPAAVPAAPTVTTAPASTEPAARRAPRVDRN